MIESNWRYLPDLVLEQIFTYLSPKERYYAGLVRIYKYYDNCWVYTFVSIMCQ